MRILVESDDFELLRDVIPWLPGGWRETGSEATFDRRYRLEFEKPTDAIGLPHYSFSIEGEHQHRTSSFMMFADRFESDIHHYIATFTRENIFVHAGAAVWNGKAIVVPGRSYAGKSTLIRALLEIGATYYSDDYAIIDESGRVHPFPRHLRLRDEGTSPQRRVNPREQGWLVGFDPVPIGIVAALKYDAEIGWQPEKVTKGSGVLALLGNTVAARERPVDALAVMSKAVECATILEGTRGEASEAAARLIQELE